MLPRIKTKQLNIAGVPLGGQNKVLIQSMCNIKTSKIKEVVKQINEAALLGASLMRVSILDQDDAYALKEIKKQTIIPIVADIHFDYKLALLALENGADKIRLNPGNISDPNKIKEIVQLCKKYKVPIRVGVNFGSLDKESASLEGVSLSEKLLHSAKKQIAILENFNFYEIVVSLKGSDVLSTIEAYRLAKDIFPYPLHLGITEAGPKDIGLIRSVAGLAPLLSEGIGDTIRISLSDEPKEEIIAAKRLLHDLNLYPNYPTIISCPTCGRTEVDVVKMAKKVLTYLEKRNLALKIAVMGCVVNGPGEAKDADYGLAGGKNKWVLFKKGQVIKTVSEDEAYEILIKEIEKDY